MLPELANQPSLLALHNVRWSWTGRVAGAFSLMLLLSWLLVNAAIYATERPQDFFQDYISARQLLARQPLYPDLAPFRKDFSEPPGGFGITGHIEVNAHPPVSILLALPVATLPYSAAAWVWEVAGVLAYVGMWWLILDGLSLRPRNARASFAVVLGALSFPALLENLIYVTMSPYISLLLVAVWYCYRRGQRRLAATLLAFAVTLKLYPAVLLGVFLLRRDWRTAITTCAAAGAICLLTIPILGLDAYGQYLAILPRITWWVATPGNWSLAGFFGRLFTDGPATVPIADAPGLAMALTILACGVVLGLPALTVLRACGRSSHSSSMSEFDALYSCGLIQLLLVSPVSWPHYSGPAALVWCVLFRREMLRQSRSSFRRPLLTCAAVVALLFPFVARLGISVSALFADQMARVAANLVLWPMCTYTLLALLLLAVHELGLTTRGSLNLAAGPSSGGNEKPERNQDGRRLPRSPLGLPSPHRGDPRLLRITLLRER